MKSVPEMGADRSVDDDPPRKAVVVLVVDEGPEAYAFLEGAFLEEDGSECVELESTFEEVRASVVGEVGLVGNASIGHWPKVAVEAP
jgi:hypothetical protein